MFENHIIVQYNMLTYLNNGGVRLHLFYVIRNMYF